MPSRSRLAVACLVVAFAAACQPAAGPAGSSSQLDISISQAGCDPVTASAPSGSVLFVVTNTGGDVAEFEVVGADDRVVDEAENIVPGFVVNLATRLDGGTYQLICGTLDSPRGTLTVTGGAAATRPPSTIVAAAELEAAVAAYRTYVLGEADKLVSEIATFTTAVESGDVDAAKIAYGPARLPWERIEPIAELFADLDPKIDAREDDYEEGVDDPEFVGFHRIEKGLWIDGSTDGLDPLAAGLRADVDDLHGRLQTLVIEPRVMARGAGELIEEVAQSKMTGEEDRYSKADLWSIDANVEGSARIVEILRPTIEKIDATYLKDLDLSFAGVTKMIDVYEDGPEDYQPFDAITAADLKALQAALANLSELLSELPGRLGLAA